MAERIIHEDAEMVITEITTDGWPDARGSSRGVNVLYKPGSEGAAQEADQADRDADAQGLRDDFAALNS